MTTLIVPCLGRKFIDNKPQFLLRHPNGKLLIERSIEGLFPNEYKKIIIVILKEDNVQFNASEIIKKEIENKYPIEIIEIDKMTSGPAETVYQTLKKTKVIGSIVIKDSDNYIKLSNKINGNFIAGLDLNDWDKDIHNLKDNSFLILNEQKNILDVIEKQIKSDVICLGVYGFNHVDDFIKAYEKLNDPSYPITKLYISHVISYLIGYYGKVFRYTSAINYENWDGERHWQDMQRDYTLYFIDLDNILGSSGILTDENKNKLLILQSRGASFIGYTTHDEGYKTITMQILEDACIKVIKVVYGCPHSLKKEIIDTDKNLERKVIEL